MSNYSFHSPKFTFNANSVEFYPNIVYINVINNINEVKMIKSLSTLISKYLEKNNSSLTKNDLLKIEYSLQVVLGDSLKLIVLLLIFSILNEVPIFLLSFLLLISIRPFLGGIHCKTFNSCLAFSIIYFILILVFIKLSMKLNTIFYILFFIISFIITLAYAPCRNEKRPIKNKAILKLLALISLTFWCILFFTLSNVQICNCIFVSILFQIIQAIIINMKGVVLNAKVCTFFFNHTN